MAKQFKVYGKNYELSPSTPNPPDAYGFKNEVIDDPPPKGSKCVGYIQMEDGSTIQCYTKFNKGIILIPILILLVLAAVAWFSLFKVEKKDVNVADGLIVKTGDDTNVVSYNGFMSINDGSADIYFQNGDQRATVTLTGEGIECAPVTVEPNETLENLPIVYKTEDGLVNATLTITTDTSTMEQQVMIEIPENNTANSPDEGLDGYWKGEAVYGTNPSDFE